MTDLQGEIRGKFQAAGRIVIVAHIRPDGDALGSMLALGLALQEAGKQVQMVCPDGVPATFEHLPGSEQVRNEPDGEFDLLVTVDCSEPKRTGNVLNGRKPDIVIDHHATTEMFGVLNLIEPEAAATASILVRHMPAWGLSFSAPVAANLLTGLITDTLGFRTPSTTPEVLRQAADLLELGVDMGTLYYRSLVRRTFPAARYWGAGLSNLQQSDGIVHASLSLADRAASGYGGRDDADLINVVASIEANKAAILFVEQEGGRVKVSWRGLEPHIDVARIARQFGGGGHRAAAGAEVHGDLPEVRERVLRATRQALDHM